MGHTNVSRLRWRKNAQGARIPLAAALRGRGMMPRSVGTCKSLCLLRSGTIVMAKKTSCPITRADFRTKAKPVPVTIGNQHLEAEPKEFSTGSLGWYLNGKTIIEIEGVRVSVQIG